MTVKDASSSRWKPPRSTAAAAPTARGRAHLHSLHQPVRSKESKRCWHRPIAQSDRCPGAGRSLFRRWRGRSPARRQALLLGDATRRSGPVRGYEGFLVPDYYCSYKRYPNRACSVDARGQRALPRRRLAAGADLPVSGPLSAHKLIPALPTLPYTPPIPARPRDAAAERLTRGRDGARLRRRCSVRSVCREASSPRIPGQAIEAVRVWQQRARTPFAQRRSLSHRAAQPPAVPNDDKPGHMLRPGGTIRLADDVVAPSALAEHRARAPTRLPIKN